MPEEKKEKPLVWAQIDQWRVIEWSDGRRQLSKRVFNPQKKQWEYRNIPISNADLLVLPKLCEKAFRNIYGEEK